MKIIYTGLQAEMYHERQKPSFEYVNFYLTLSTMSGVQVLEYPYDPILEQGKYAWNKGLVELVKRETPDIIFSFMYTDELDKVVLDRIRKETSTKIVGWFADDYWRFWNYSRFWAPYMDLVVTTSGEALQWYKEAGFKNVVLEQWAANPAVFHPIDIQQDIDVSFVGQYKSGRGKLVDALRKAGINVECFGSRWPNGRVPFEDLPKIFSRTKINLNLNARPSRFEPRALGRIAFVKSRNRIVPSAHFVRNIRAWFHMGTPHIHARPFEILACNAFLISGFAEGVDQYYADGKEIVYFNGGQKDLIGKVQYYLERNEERKRIAQAGYGRTISEHTYAHRFTEIFKHLGLS